MDSRGNALRLIGFKSNLGLNGRTILCPDGKTTFAALIEEADPLDPQMPIGDDLREYHCIHVIRESAPALNSQDEVRADTDRFKIVKRIDNEANPIIKFYAVKIVPEDT